MFHEKRKSGCVEAQFLETRINIRQFGDQKSKFLFSFSAGLHLSACHTMCFSISVGAVDELLYHFI